MTVRSRAGVNLMAGVLVVLGVAGVVVTGERPLLAAQDRTQAAPGVPQNLSASSTDAVLALQWSAPTSGDAATGYMVRAGTSPGANDLYDGSVGAVFAVSAAVPAGRYYLSVAAYNASGVGPYAAEVQALVGVDRPGMPGMVAATAQGGVVSVTWQAPGVGGPVASYVLRAGTMPGAANLFTGSVGLATAVSAPLPAGSYFISVAAQNAAGLGPLSPEVSVVVAGCAPPDPPTNLQQVTSSPNSVSMQWTAPPTPVQLYVVEAGSVSGATDIGRFDHSATPGVWFPSVPGGTYYVRVRSRTPCGESAPSNELVVTVGAPLPNVSGTWTLTRVGSSAYPWIQTYGSFVVTLVQTGSQLTGSIRPTNAGAPATPISLGSVSSAGVVFFGSESAYWNDSPGTLGSDGYFRLALDGTGRAMSGACPAVDTCATASATRN